MNHRCPFSMLVVARACAGIVLALAGQSGGLFAEEPGAGPVIQAEAPSLGAQLLIEELQFALETAHRPHRGVGKAA